PLCSVFLLLRAISRVFSLREDHGHRQNSRRYYQPRPSKPSKARQALCPQREEPRVILSVVIITRNEEASIGRTLASVQPLVADGKGEIIIVDSGSTDRTVEIAKSFGAKVFVEEWKGDASQKNSAIDKAASNWVLSLDADEEISPRLAEDIIAPLKTPSKPSGFFIPRKNMFLGRWIRHGGFWPDPKLRLFDRTSGR